MKKKIIFIALLVLIGVVSHGQSTYNLNEDRNWISSSSYDLDGNIISAGVSYFNSLGRVTQSQTLDIKTGKIWASEVRYDEFGRAAFSTLGAPIGNNYGFKSDFIKKSNGSLFTQTDLLNLKDSNSSISIGGYTNTLGWYYSNNNTSEMYQDVTSFPYSRVVFSKLNSGDGLRILGGKKVRRTPTSPEEWIQGYSFSMPMAQELYYAFGTGYFTSRTQVLNHSGIYKTPHYISGNKQVVRDVHGIESVVFTDSGGRVLAAARSGNEDNTNRKKYKVLSPIGEQGYVDIHIPKGCDGTVYFKGPSSARFKIYDLTTDLVVSGKTNVGGSTFLNSGMYRIEEISSQKYHKNKSPFVNIVGNTIQLLDTNYNVGVEYYVNYYDYSLNYYDKSGRLTENVQPLGFDSRLDLTATRSHRLVSNFSYNSLGQLINTTSPDEGTAEFKYRKDGQIRFSQNVKQAKKNAFSYTNYDVLGRPVESGVASGSFDSLDPDVEAFSGTREEQHFTLYDVADTAILNSKLSANGISSFAYLQKFVEGSVSKTYTQNPTTTTTWYSYDAYGRVEWMVQDIEGLGIKTIDYEYDFTTGLVTKVLYQKNSNNGDRFIHRYTYNTSGELTKVETSTDNSNFVEQARYEYYETGALKRTVLAENAQGIDYIYSLNGQLKAINHPSRDKNLDPGNDGNNGVAQDLFGFALDYYSGDYSRTNTPRPITSSSQGLNQFNGNIKSTRWSTGILAGGNQAGQIYSYNKNNWLQRADFGSAQNTGVISTGTDYQVSGINYDANGNIKTLSRNKNFQNGSNAMDAFTYNYNFYKPNQLTHITDAVTSQTNTDDLKTQQENNYIYNSIGQLEVNKQELVAYHYNASGLVKGISRIVNSNEGTGTTPPKPFTIFRDNFDEFVTPTSTTSGTISLIKNYNWELLNQSSSMSQEVGLQLNLPTGCFISGEIPMARLVLINASLGGKFGGTTSNSGVQKLFDAIETKEHTFHLDIIRKKTDTSTKGGILPQYPIELEVKTSAGLVLASKTIPASTSFNSCNSEFLKQSTSIDYTAPTGVTEVFLIIKNTQANTTSEFYIDNVEHTVLAEPAVDFYYDDRGFRARKEAYIGAYKAITWYIRDASGNPMAIIHQPGARGAANTEENPIYGAGRIGMYKRQSNTSLYELKDHLGNVRATILKSGNALAAISSATDYYPFGMPMPNRQIVGGEPYRYAYQGQEKDPETGKEAFQLRLWDSRIGRWLTIDPAGQYPSPYMGMGNNPISMVDPDGGTACPDPPCNGGHQPPGTEAMNSNLPITQEVYGLENVSGSREILDEVIVRGKSGSSFSMKDIANTSITFGSLAYSIGSEAYLKKIDYVNLKLTPKGHFPAYYRGELVYWKDGFRGNKQVSYDDVLEAKANYTKNLKAGKNLVRLGKGLTYVGYGLTVYDYGSKIADGSVNENDHLMFGADTVFTGISFLPGGFIVSGAYFIFFRSTFSNEILIGRPMTIFESRMILIDNTRVHSNIHMNK